MNATPTESHGHPIILVSFDDEYAARFVKELEGVCPAVHVSPFMRTLRASIESLQPSIAIFDLQTVKTEEHSIFDIMASVTEHFPHIRKIAVGHQNISSQVIAAMKSGACDFVDRDAAVEDLRNAIRQQLRQGRRSEGERAGHVIALVSGQENEGETQIAANLAAYIASSRRHQDVLLLDLNLENSRFEIEFNVEVTYSVHDAIDELIRLDKSMLSNVLARHHSGLFLLPLVTGRRNEEEVSPQELATLLSTLRSFFSIIIITAGCLRTKYCRPYLLPLCDEVVVVCRQLIGSVREAREIVADELVQNDHREKFSLLLSHYDADIDLSDTQVTARLGIPLAGTIPRAWVAIANSHNAGLPLVLSSPGNPYARAVRHLANHLLAGQADDAKPLSSIPRVTLGRLLEQMRKKLA